MKSNDYKFHPKFSFNLWHIFLKDEEKNNRTQQQQQQQICVEFI